MSTPTQSVNIPTASNGTKKFGQNTEDYNKYVVVDTKGVLIAEGQVVLGFDLLKDKAEEGIKTFLEALFETVGFKTELRTGRQEKTVKAVSPQEIMKMIQEGKL